MLRYTLYEARTPYVPLQPELNALLDYVQLQELRLQEQVDVSLHLTVAHAEGQQVPSGVLLPLTERWLTLATTRLELDLRVHADLLTLTPRAAGRSGPVPAVAATLHTRLAHRAPTHQLTTHYAAGVHTLTLRLPLRPVVAPVPNL